MTKLRTLVAPQVVDADWITFPGGELEGPRPKVLCPACRAKLRQAANARVLPQDRQNPSNLSNFSNLSNPSNLALCFQCYRASVERDRALKAAGELDTASEERFQSALPFEPVNQTRLARLRVERATVRVTEQAGVGRYVDKRRHAQIAARHALERVVAGLRARGATKPEQDRVLSSAIHAAELQLPEAWLPFVVSR
jgi:hypothetical protein